MHIPSALRNKIAALPDKPGCYIMRDGRGRIIYVGKAVSLRKRVSHYFQQGTLRSADPKQRGLIRSVADLDFVETAGEAEAVLTEGRLIKEYRPRYNVSFRDDKRFLLLRVDMRSAFPRLELCRIGRDDGRCYFGPYASSSSARTAVEFVEKRFGLRRCRPAVPTAEDHVHCINDIVRYCSAPCVGSVTADEYGERLAEACAFLRGERPQYLREVRASMDEAAGSLEFERAAALRDALRHLSDVTKSRAMALRNPGLKREESMRGVLELGKLLKLRNNPREIEAYDISNISGTHAVGGMVYAVDGVPQRNRYRRFRIRTAQGVDDARMIAEIVSRSFARRLKEGRRYADIVLVDGGMAQLRAARAELRKLGLNEVPVVGLAKRYEELYPCPDGPPVRLPRDSAALKVMQRIRDEAHRFALDYHRNLRRKLFRESLLDELPGIGPKRKEQLLLRFGSVPRLARASVADIAAMPGIGAKLAESILQVLRKPVAGAEPE